MKSLLGLPIFRKPLSDAEIVERARRDIIRWQRYGKWLLLFQTALIIVWICAFYLIAFILIKVGQFAGGQVVNLALSGLVIGFIFGFGFSAQYLHTLEEWGKTIKTLKGDRTSVLLVKYHDALIEIIRERENHEEQSNCHEEQSRAGQGGRRKEG